MSHPEFTDVPQDAGVSPPAVPNRTSDRRASRALNPAVALLALLAAVVLVAWIAQAYGDEEWRADDWASVAIALLLGVFFLVLAQRLQRNQVTLQEAQNRLSRALANLALREKVGAIADHALRARGGRDEYSLRVAPDALAAMHLIDLAEPPEQRRLLQVVGHAYSSLTTSSFTRIPWLPGAYSAGLRQGAADLRQVLASPSLSSDPLVRGDAERLAEHIRVCVRLAGIWQKNDRNHSGLGVDFVKALYEEELLLHHDWGTRGVETLSASVETWRDPTHLTDLGRYFAPWYVEADGKGEAGYAYREVDYLGRPLRRPHGRTRIELDHELPTWKSPLRHDQVPVEMRAHDIGRMRMLLERLSPASFAILVYQLVDGRRIVMDGNHRLAAALRIWRDREPVTDSTPPFAVTVFVLAESSALSGPGRQADFDPWSGLFPDADRVRTYGDPGV